MTSALRLTGVVKRFGATLALDGGEGGILGSMLGALVMAFLRNGSQQMGWPTTCRRS